MRGPSDVRGIRLQQEGAAEVRGTQDRLRGERCLHLPKVLLPLACPAHLFWLPFLVRSVKGAAREEKLGMKQR